MPQFIKEGEYVTASEAARILGRNHKRITQLMKDGKLPFVEFRTFRLIPYEAVIARKERQEREWPEWNRDGNSEAVDPRVS